MTRAQVVPKCHPDRPHEARELCETCYSSVRHYGTQEQHPRRTWRAADLAAAGQEIYDELTAAAGYGEPPTWQAVADRLGVPLKNLQQARRRAARYAAREVQPKMGRPRGGGMVRRETGTRDLLAEDPRLFLDEGEELVL